MDASPYVVATDTQAGEKIVQAIAEHLLARKWFPEGRAETLKSILRGILFPALKDYRVELLAPLMDDGK
jgi:hypothetical protein